MLNIILILISVFPEFPVYNVKRPSGIQESVCLKDVKNYTCITSCSLYIYSGHQFTVCENALQFTL